MSARIDALLHWLWQSLILGIVGIVCMGAGVRFNKALVGDQTWPYRVKQTIVYTPEVPRGGTFRYARDIDYFRDCALYYDRAMLSLVPDEHGALRRNKLDTIKFERPPLYVDDRLQSQDIPVPADFPCGPAMIIDSPYAYCNRYQRWFNDPLTRKDAITRFEVSCQTANRVQ